MGSGAVLVHRRSAARGAEQLQGAEDDGLSRPEDRLAISVWFICGAESLRNAAAFQRLFCPTKLRPGGLKRAPVVAVGAWESAASAS